MAKFGRENGLPERSIPKRLQVEASLAKKKSLYITNIDLVAMPPGDLLQFRI